MSGIEKGNAAFLVQVLNRLGLNTDVAGALTVFAQLQRIYESVDQLEGFTDTLETGQANIKAKTDLIGAAADAAGTATLFAQLNQLRAYTDTIESTEAAIKAKTDLIGAAADAAGTATLFALLKKLDAKPNLTGTIVASNTLQESFPTSNAGGAYYKLVGKFIPKGTGELRITFNATNAAGSALSLYVISGAINTTSSQPITTRVANFDYRTPIGTVLAANPTGHTSISIPVGPTATFVAYEAYIQVRELAPIYLFLDPFNSITVKDIAVYYDTY